MSSNKKKWQETRRWLRVGALSASAISPFINILLARLRANIEAEEALAQLEKDELEGKLETTSQEINLDLQERLQAVGATLNDLLLEMRENPYSQRLLQRSEDLRERGNQLSQAVAERSNQLSQAVTERSSKLSQAVAERGSQLSQAVAERSSQLTQDLAERSGEISQDLAQRSLQARRGLAARDRNFWILFGFSTGLVAAAIATFFFVRRRLQQSAGEEDSIQIPYENASERSATSQPRGNIYSIGANGTKLEAQSSGNNTVSANTAHETSVPNVPASETSETVAPISTAADTTAEHEISRATHPADAAFVGVSSTKQYYPAETPLDQLHPANGEAIDVIYFSSEDEARSQGFSAALR